MLGLASAMPAGFSWDVIRAVSDAEEAALLDALDEALSGRLIRERKDASGVVYEFHHALIRQTLYEELSAPRRVLLHRRIGERLESLYAGKPGPHLAELAHHFFEAAPGGDVAKAADYAVRAGERAYELAAYEDSVGHYERALQALDLTEDDPERRCDVHLALAQAQIYTGASRQGRAIAERATELARGLGDPVRLGRAALLYGSPFAGDVELDEPRVVALQEALSALGNSEPALRAEVLSRLATCYMFIDTAEAAGFAERSLELARASEDPAARAFALAATYLSRGGPEALEERLAIADELVDAAREAGLLAVLVGAHWDGPAAESGPRVVAERGGRGLVRAARRRLRGGRAHRQPRARPLPEPRERDRRRDLLLGPDLAYLAGDGQPRAARDRAEAAHRRRPPPRLACPTGSRLHRARAG
jgi:hypothetical protein